MRIPLVAGIVATASAVVSAVSAGISSSATSAYSSSSFSRELSALATCSFESDVDYAGNDIASVIAPASDCCNLCSARNDCGAYTWTSYNGGTCWLKSSKGTTKVTTGAKSGVITPISVPSAPSSCSLEVGVDYTGNDIGSVSGTNAADCCSKCSARSGCGAFSWSNYNGGTCWLKSNKGVVASNAAVTSGVVKTTPASSPSPSPSPSPLSSTATVPSNSTLCGSVEQGIDYIGNDIGNLPGLGATDCCTKCSSRSGCRAFSWSNYNGGTCWLKSAKGTTQVSSGVISAVVSHTYPATQTEEPPIPTPTTAKPSTPSTTASNISSTHIQYKIRSGEIPSRSVNLGGWLVCEYWMSKTSPAWKNVPANIAGTGEYGVMKYLGKEQGTKQFEEHRATWITEADIQEIAKVGLNMVRVPVGFWIVDEIAGVAPTDISSVYARGSLKYLDKLINEWAVKYNVAVYLSLHAHQGSQNGYDHSAPQQMGQMTWSNSQANVDNSVGFATALANRYKDAPAFVGLQLMNEPAGVTNPTVCEEYYKRAYKEIRANGNICIVGVSPMLARQDQSALRDFMRTPQYTNVWMEWHVYYKWGYENLPEDTIISLVKTYRDSHFVDWPGNPVLIGEWSLGNGYIEEKFKDVNKLKEFAAAQLQQYSEAHAGWAFWSWRHDDEYLLEADGRNVTSGWNLRQLLRLGIFTIPK